MFEISKCEHVVVEMTRAFMARAIKAHQLLKWKLEQLSSVSVDLNVSLARARPWSPSPQSFKSYLARGY